MGISELYQFIIQSLQRPGSEFYWPYVISALVITLAALKYQFKLTLKESFAVMTSKSIWWNRSTRTDFILSMFYALVLAGPAFSIQYYGGTRAYDWLNETILSESFFHLALPVPIEGVLVTLTTMLALDFATYIVHVALHKIPYLWQLHSVHHAAEHLNIFTTHRQHPFEPILLNFFRGVFSGMALAIFYWFFPNQTPVISVMGMGAGFFIYMFTVNLHHLHIPIRYPIWLRLVVISPHIHHLHHSQAQRHIDKNYGVVFSIWDRLFGTYIDEEPELNELKFGIVRDDLKHSIWRSWLRPLIPPVFNVPTIDHQIVGVDSENQKDEDAS